METKTLVLVGLIIGIIIIAGIYSGLGRTIVSAQGVSSIEVSPDIAAIYFNVQVINDSAESAKDEVARIVAELEDSLLDVVDENEITTTSFNIYPNYVYSGRGNEIKGYVASQSIEVRTERIDKVARIVDKGVDAGALVSWINFELSNEHEQEVKAEALTKAAEDGKNKASAIAKGLGKRLGRLVSVETSNFNYYPYRYYEASMEAGGVDVKQAALNINPKDLDVSASVEVVYGIW